MSPAPTGHPRPGATASAPVVVERAFAALDEFPLVELTQALVRIDSGNPPGHDEPVGELIATQAAKWGLDATLQPVAEHRSNVLVRLPGVGGGPTLLLCGHLDTGPAGDEAWGHDPFGGEVADGRIYGRGAADMKSGLAAMLAAMAALRRSGARLAGDVVLAGMAGEVSDFLGSRHFLAAGGMKGVSWLVVGEPTNLDFVVAHRGVLWVEATTYGRAAHGSAPQLRRNAIGEMMALLKRVAEWQCPGDAHPLLPPPSLSVNMIAGGQRPNFTPGMCRMTMDVRTLPSHDGRAIVAALEALAADIGQERSGFRADFRILGDQPPVETAPGHPLVLAAQRAADVALKEQRKVRGASYYSDAAVLQPATGVPTLIFGPGDDRVGHQPNEFIAVPSLWAAARLLIALPFELYDASG